MTDEKDQEMEEEDLEEGMSDLKELIEKVAPHFIEYHKIRAPLIRRQQIFNFVIVISIILAVVGLAYFKIIDGSAATGLIGAIIGYVFGSLYPTNVNR